MKKQEIKITPKISNMEKPLFLPLSILKPGKFSSKQMEICPLKFPYRGVHVSQPHVFLVDAWSVSRPPPVDFGKRRMERQRSHPHWLETLQPNMDLVEHCFHLQGPVHSDSRFVPDVPLGFRLELPAASVD
jgi:hypothetical protein